MMETTGRTQAVAELVGALCYALLRVYQLTAAATASAPSVSLAEQQATFANEEFARHRLLRARLDQLTDDPEAAMGRFREIVDGFYEAARPDEWLEAQTFHFVGNAITKDFAELAGDRFDDDTATAVKEALTTRTRQESFSLAQILGALEQGGVEARERVAHYAAHMIGQGLNRFREALLASDTLEVALGGPDQVKEVVLELLGRHRERLERLGVETVG